MSTPNNILQLVNRFEQNRKMYHLGRFNETQLRREFLDPFFEALGWDVANKQGYAELYKDVIHEDSLEVEGANKAPDYAFRIGGTRKFFVEAKKPAVNIESNIHPAYQLRRYAWSAKLPLGILTDFEEFAVYDCRIKPDVKDKASTSRVLFLSYKDYLDKWDTIASIFSREAILKGSFDSYAEGIKGKKGTSEVDDEFLAEIERWRELLARNIALRNQNLTARELNFAVQMTIDRIVFLRICEDRGIERDEQLKDIAAGKNIYENLCYLFQRADVRYNSGLFHFKKEKDQSSGPDSLTLSLKIDDKSLKDILKNLYYPESPYVFKEIPSDILGQVYERFLGKVIHLTSSHQAKIEEKPEVRKAGGVYYTPTFIVDYIVENTVGKLLEGKTPKEVEILKILDPACGSGTFVLGAYQYLLDWHLKWYTEKELEKSLGGKKPVLFQCKDGYQLTTTKKKEILLNNIFGVDIDSQAVEVTKLSLLLKVLENENHQTIGSQLSLLQERVLPDLGKNIQCGNSLIGSEYYEGQQLSLGLENEEERYRVNAFDWKAAFPHVFAQGGFDAVIGNPPYIRIQTMQETSPIDVEFFKRNYKAASKGNYDIYVIFVEKGISLLNEKGKLGFILPHKFFNAKYGEPLRAVIAKGKHLSKVVHFGDQQVFENATTYTCLMFLSKAGQEEFDFEKVLILENWKNHKEYLAEKIVNTNLTSAEWNFTVGSGSKLFQKLAQMPIKLSDVTQKIFQGLVTSCDPVYFLEPLSVEGEGYVEVKSNSTGKVYRLESEVVKPLIKGSRDISRYHAEPSKRVVFPYDPIESARSGKTILISEKDFKTKFPNTWRYLKENFDTLRNREKGKMQHDGWYGYVYPKSVALFGQPKLLTPSIAAKASFVFDENGEYYFVGSGGGGGGGYGIIIHDDAKITYKYLLGLLNSRLLDYYLKQISSPFRGGYFAFNKQYIEQLPIRTINFSDPAEKTRHDRMVSLVERILTLRKRVPRTPQDQEIIKREIESTDRQIDSLVYELYGLHQEEIKVIEG